MEIVKTLGYTVLTLACSRPGVFITIDSVRAYLYSYLSPYIRQQEA